MGKGETSKMFAANTVKSTEYRDSVGVALRVTIVSLALATAYIHFTLGSMLFLANAVGYAVLAAGMVVPLGILVRNRWFVRAALAGFTTVTIIGWAMIGPRFMLAYVDKGIELALVALLIVEMFRYDGGPVNVIRKGLDLVATIVRMPFSGRNAA
jgi:hypothetical protein